MIRHILLLPTVVLLVSLTSCETLPTRTSTTPAPIYAAKPWHVEEGIASWYGGRWIGRLTANGERYRATDMTAAHKKLPFRTMVRVTDLKTGKQVIVRINNRGPFKRGRIIDLSVVAARQLGMYDRGLAKVRIEALREIPQAGAPNLSLRQLRERRAAAETPSPSPSTEARRAGQSPQAEPEHSDQPPGTTTTPRPRPPRKR